MKVGLLVCDHVAKEFKSIDGDYVDMFKRLLPALELIPYFVCNNEFPKSIHSHNAYLCTGSSHSVYEELEWINNLGRFIRQAHDQKKKFVGICFGHQMIAHALGGKVQKADIGWCIGVHSFRLSKKNKWLQPERETFNVLMLCQDQVVELPEKSQVLGTSDQCSVGMYKVGAHMMGIQGHPEFSREYNKTVYESRIDRIGTEKIAAANQALQKSTDTEVIAEWIVNFIT